MQFKILKGFRHAEQFFQKDAGKELDLLATNPTPEQLADWQKRGLVTGVSDETQSATVLVANPDDPMVREILDILASEEEEGETPVEVLRRLIGERNALADEISSLQTREQPTDSEAVSPQNEETASPSSSGEGGQPPVETELTATQLSEATNAKVALALLDAGFNTKEKIRAATSEQLKAIEGLGEGMLAKLRDLVQ